MASLVNIVENPQIHLTLKRLVGGEPLEQHYTFRWVSKAQVTAFPMLDVSSFSAHFTWTNADQCIKLCRKLGIVLMIYQRVGFPTGYKGHTGYKE